jgi:hypothetical protein
MGKITIIGWINLGGGYHQPLEVLKNQRVESL